MKRKKLKSNTPTHPHTNTRLSNSKALQVAVKAARAAGAIQMRSLGKLKRSQVKMKGASDWVTAIDFASEKKILTIIRKAFPDHAILAEESGALGKAETEWVIDPLDGTVNFMHQFPMFCVSIAMRHQGVLQVGVVYDPMRDELFTAQRGKGAFLDGRRIRISKHSVLRESILATGFPFRAKRVVDVYMASFKKLFMKTGSIRRAGSAALDLAYTACGRVDGFWEMYLKPWDMAAGALLIQEAGGTVTDFFGKEDYLESGNITAGNPKLHAKLVKLLKPIFKGKV